MTSSYLESTGLALLIPLIELWNSLVEIAPGILAAIIVTIVGYIISAAFGLLFNRFLETTKVDMHLKRAGLAHSIGFINIATLGGALLKWYLFVSLFLVQAVGFLKLGILSEQLRRLVEWVPNLFAALIILLVGLVLSDLLANRVLHAKRRGIRIFSGAVKIFAIIYVALISLETIGIDTSFATNTILLLIAGAVLGTAIAFGIGFGSALKEEAKNAMKALKKNW